tara:strand:+ start:574 stop:822 length:249 start_codon:yes stop_codon:yes gene_type:complete
MAVVVDQEILTTLPQLMAPAETVAAVTVLVQMEILAYNTLEEAEAALVPTLIQDSLVVMVETVVVVLLLFVIQLLVNFKTIK